MSGTASVYGEFAEQGLQLAVEEINQAGGTLGRPVEYELQDSQLKVDVAIQAARKIVYQNQVHGLLGIDSCGVAAGLVPTIPELNRPLIITHAATPDVTGKLCNRNTFRVSVNINQNMKGAAMVAAETGAKRWTSIGPDHAFRRQSWEFFGNYLKEIDPEVELMDQTAFSTSSTSPMARCTCSGLFHLHHCQPVGAAVLAVADTRPAGGGGRSWAATAVCLAEHRTGGLTPVVLTLIGAGSRGPSPSRAQGQSSAISSMARRAPSRRRPRAVRP